MTSVTGMREVAQARGIALIKRFTDYVDNMDESTCDDIVALAFISMACSDGNAVVPSLIAAYGMGQESIKEKTGDTTDTD